MPRQPLVSELSRRRKLRMFTRHVPRGSTVLEVGAGDGWFASRLRGAGYRVTTLDETALSAPDVVGDILQWEKLGLAAGAFDAVVALEVIEHVDCMDALRALCRPGGFIFLSSPHPRWDWVLMLMEHAGLTQPRTSPHDRLTDFERIPLEPLFRRRPLWIHQVAMFRNTPRARS